MFLEKKREAEIAERQGTVRRTVIMSVWLLISVAAAYGATEYLIFGGDEPLLNISILTRLLQDTFVPVQYRILVVKIGMITLVVLVMQVIFMMSFMFGSQEGRQKAGQPTLKSRTKDPYEQRW